MNDAQNKLVGKLVKDRPSSRGNDPVIVLFSECPDGQIRLYTYGIYTDYTTSFYMSKEEARNEWKRLRSEGFRKEAI